MLHFQVGKVNGDEWVDSIKNPELNNGIFSLYEFDMKPIGIGGFSKVYKVRKNGRAFAMKIPSFIQMNDDVTVRIDSSVLANFKNEAINWSLISEKAPDSVVRLIDFNVDPFPWMVMELAEGSLKDYIISEEASVKDVIEALDCLENVHSAGIIHRDIKPENILKVNGKWKLSDFGLSKVMGSMSRSTSGLKGTPQYMAPEQVSRKMFGDVDVRTDIWQMGVILYEVLMHKLPYPVMDFAELGMAIIGDGPDYKDAPKEYQSIFLKTFSKEKDKRYSSAAEFASELRAVVERPVVTRSISKKSEDSPKISVTKGSDDRIKGKIIESKKSSGSTKKPYGFIAAIALIVVTIVVAGAFMMNDSGVGGDDEAYYFFIDFGDNDAKTGWYSATGTNADSALESSVKDTGITVTYSKYGYPNFDNEIWGTFVYIWDQCSILTADESIKSPSYGSYNQFIKSNGWEVFSAYGDGEKKLCHSESNVFYFAKYDSETYEIQDPVKSTIWKSKVGSPFLSKVDFSDPTTYYFFINFGDADVRTGWYSANGSNADDALVDAVKDKGIIVSHSRIGYPTFDDGYWGVFNYTWAECTVTAADNSIKNPHYYDSDVKLLIKSDGWDSYSGYDTTENILNQSMSKVFYFSKYDSETYAIDDPTENIVWMNESGSPFFA